MQAAECGFIILLHPADIKLSYCSFTLYFSTCTLLKQAYLVLFYQFQSFVQAHFMFLNQESITLVKI